MQNKNQTEAMENKENHNINMEIPTNILDGHKENREPQQPKHSILKSPINNNKQGNEKRVRFKIPKTQKKKTELITEIRLLYANANGIGDKMISLETAADTYEAHIIAITETKNLPPIAKGYSRWISKERKGRMGGGVAIAVRQDLSSKISKVEDLGEEDQEIVWIELRITNNQRIYVGTYYGKQENAPIKEIEREYSKIRTQISILQTKGEIILMGDFNAKLDINKENYQQTQSRNGKQLQGLIDDLQLKPISLKSHTGTCTWKNRHNNEEHSTIDYIITTEKLAKQTREVIVDEEGIYRIKGRKHSDHNTILTKIGTNIKVNTKIIKRWKLNNKEGWEKYNKEIQKAYKDKGIGEQMNLGKIIVRTLQHTVGQVRIRTGSHKPKETQEVKQLRQEKNEACRKYEHSIKKKDGCIKENLEKYFKAQRRFRERMEDHNKKDAENKLAEMAREGGTKSNLFWKMQKEREGKNDKEDYDLITEEGIKIDNPEEAKEYIAEYFEKLYQGRKGKIEYQAWTRTIEEKVKEIEKELEKALPIEAITTKELNTAISKLKRKKATGPDQIPNEAFLEADKRTRSIYKEALNSLVATQTIPEEWQEGKILRLYKGKGKKGKCSNERGITLASNLGKLYERIMNERIKRRISMSDAQAGGRKHSATVDHILVLKELITHAKNKKKSIHIAFLDVTKAYDKAWTEAIMYVLHKEGLTDNHWTISKKLNHNLTATIETKFGPTRKIQMSSIRQGGVLSVLEFGLLMDETSKDIAKEKLGITIEGMDNQVGSLLWVDDIIMAEIESQNLQRMLDVAEHTSNKYHIEYGESKSNVMTIQFGGNQTKPIFKLGSTRLKETNNYKYLGFLQNNKNNMKDHLRAIKGKVEATYQRIIALAGNTTFKNIEMESIWTNVQSKMEPITTYSGEVWDLNKGQTKELNAIMDNILKRILKVPPGTPREALYIETGLLDPVTIVKKNRINMETRIQRNGNKLVKEVINSNQKNGWKQKTKMLKEEIGITDEDTTGTKNSTKKKIGRKINKFFKESILEQGRDKSKVQYLLEGRGEWTPGKRPEYMIKLTRNQVSTMFKARTRMLKIKANYKKGQKDLMCRACKTTIETQQHILEDCKILHEEKTKTKKEELFDKDIQVLKKAIIKIEKTMNKLEEIEKIM